MAAAMVALIGNAAFAARPEKVATPAIAVTDSPMPLGAPYAVAGVTYTPADPLSYDEVGYAGASAGGSENGVTVNGEAFNPAAIVAAHKTLPVPCYVEVTALDSGRTILVRVNDRGPMRNDQLIALSPGALAQLGLSGEAVVPVRVRRVNPPEQERAVLRTQGRAAERLETPAPLLKVLRSKVPPVRSVAVAVPAAPANGKGKPVAIASRPATPPRPGADFDQGAPVRAARPPSKPVSPPKVAAAPVQLAQRSGGYVVQVGAFSSQSRAEALARQLGARTEQGGGYWRVRLGPYATQQAAQAGLRTATAKGFENARIMANDAR